MKHDTCDLYCVVTYCDSPSEIFTTREEAVLYADKMNQMVKQHNFHNVKYEVKTLDEASAITVAIVTMMVIATPPT